MAKRITTLKHAPRRFPYLRTKPYGMLHIECFTFNPFQENTYVAYTPSGECIVVDPGCSNASEERMLDDFISRKELEVKGILCTHCHIDHVMGLLYVAKRYALTPIIPQGELSVLQSSLRVADLYGLSFNGLPEVAFFTDTYYEFGGERLEILEVPGHSPAHIALYHKASGQLISGDVLFHRSIGRTDLPGGDFDTLAHSIRTKIYTLPDATRVYAGHMETTTVGEEKQHNPFVKP